jgi:hypothetical protein
MVTRRLPSRAALSAAYLVRELLPDLVAAERFIGGLAGVIVAVFSWWIVPVAQTAARRGAQIVAQSVAAGASIVSLVSIVEIDPTARYSPFVAAVLLAAAAGLHLVTMAPDVARARAAGSHRALDTLTLGAIGMGAAFAAILPTSRPE